MKHETLVAALAAFQSELPKVTKGARNSHFKNKYATLEDLSNIVLPLLGKHGLAWTTAPTRGEHGFVLNYRLLHVSGQSLGGSFPLPGGVSPQQLGSALTYYRRYALGAVTGVAPDEDDDGNAGISVPPQVKRAESVPPAAFTSAQWSQWADRVAATTTVEGLRGLWQDAACAGVLSHVTPGGKPLSDVLAAAKEQLEGDNVLSPGA